MRDLVRNQCLVYYANYANTEAPSYDEYGNEISGGEAFIYESPRGIYLYKGNVTGEVQNLSIGSVEDYDIVLSTTDRDCPIMKNAKVWVEHEPTGSHDYEIKKRAPSLNGVVYGATRVRVDG